MPDLAGLEALPSKRPLLVTLAVRPDEIELALATNGASLRQRLIGPRRRIDDHRNGRQLGSLCSWLERDGMPPLPGIRFGTERTNRAHKSATDP